MKKYEIYYAGGEIIATISATCITKACKQFICALEKPAKYEMIKEKWVL